MRLFNEYFVMVDVEREVLIYDTTLRDGNQAVDVNLSVRDKLIFSRKLDEFGVAMIEGGWPNPTNPAEREYFEKAMKLGLRSEIAAFGMTRKAGLKAEEDSILNYLADTPCHIYTLFGKSWSLHVRKVLNTTLDENLEMISDTVSFLKKRGKSVVYDAEHFYDGFKDDEEYALQTLEAAEEAGADWIVLCDTRGASTPFDIYEITKRVSETIKVPLGIHAHNDIGMGVANSISAVKAGATMVQGTINGIGERCGNADLIEVIGVLEFRMNVKTGVKVSKLTEISQYLYELATIDENPRQPFVGRYAFSHKGGVHGHAVLKTTEAYEFIDPSIVGNQRALIVSSQAGTASLAAKAVEFGFQLSKRDPRTLSILKKVKEMEAEGYVFENADASLYLLIARMLLEPIKFFEIEHWTTIVVEGGDRQVCESVVKLRVGDAEIISSAEGNGPVNAFDKALKKAIITKYPELKDVYLRGYRVRELDTESGTAAKVRVFIEFEKGDEHWSTVGVSSNILNASKEALVDGYLYYLLKSYRG